jgi:hypothetical protein
MIYFEWLLFFYCRWLGLWFFFWFFLLFLWLFREVLLTFYRCFVLFLYFYCLYYCFYSTLLWFITIIICKINQIIPLFSIKVILLIWFIDMQIHYIFVVLFSIRSFFAIVGIYHHSNNILQRKKYKLSQYYMQYLLDTCLTWKHNQHNILNKLQLSFFCKGKEDQLDKLHLQDRHYRHI